MRKLKKLTAIFGICFAMVIAIMPLAAWTNVAQADEATAPDVPAATSAFDYGVMPLYGGTDTKEIVFPGVGTVTVTASAGNWIWPGTDEAVITIRSNCENTYYGFIVKFVWANSAQTEWVVPDKFNVDTGLPLKVLNEINGNWQTKYTMKCNSKSLTGTPGSGWSCAHIKVTVIVKIGEDVQKYVFPNITF